jgi:predicted outer membrane repeat protein
VWHVTTTGTGTDGSTWATAVSLQYALGIAAANDEIWVAKGIYRPTTGTDRNISFVIPNGVRVYGGFVGSEASLNQRPLQAIGGNGKTLLSGDINTLADATDNTYQVVAFAGINSPTLLDGFSIIHGNANGSTHELRNGGGVQVTDNGANVSINHCTIALNNAKFTAGVSTSSTSSLLMDKCIVQFNKSESGTGGVSLAGSNSVVTNSVFLSNEGTEGVGALTFENSNNNSRVTNCLFVNNIGVETGAVYTEEGTGHRLVNCTFHNNNTTGSFAGAAEQIYSAESGTIELKNCIVTTSIGTMRPLLNSFNNTITVSYSNIQGGFTGIGNIQSNPLFINSDDPDGPDNLWATADDGLNIQGCSPSKNTGTNTDAPATDIVGTTRPQYGTVDMGVYETTLNPLVYSRVYVKANASGANNGTSWDDAFTSLQSALGYPCFAPNAEIWVAAGTYRPTQNQFKSSTGATDRSNTFLIPSGVSVYGGFIGGETDKNQRSLPTAGANGNTILSGDLLGDDAPSFANRTDNALHVVLLNNVTEPTRLDGFVIKGGYADQNTEIYPSALVGSTNSNGSGLFNNAGGNNLTLAYCTVTDNHSLGEGGGMATMALSDGQGRSSLPLVTHCKFENNKAGARGGGISVLNGGGGAPFAAIGITAINTQFTGNEAIDGGGLSLRPIYGTATLSMDGCSVTNNTATGSGGGIALIPQGDAAIPSAVTATINNTTISGNQIGNTVGNSGAGISGFFLTNTNNTLTITNSIITHNTAASPTSRGGGIGVQTAPQTVGTSALLQLSVSNTTIANNQAAFGGGAHVGAAVLPAALPVTTGITTTFTDCIIRDNTAVGRGGGLVLRSFGNHKNTLTRCVFSNNTADNGGAIDIAGETFETTVGTLEGEMNECLFVNNTATTRGGAIRYDDGFGTKTWTFRNCTATGNTAGQHGFFTIENWNSGQTAPTFRNSIAYGNGANSIRLNGGNILFANSLIGGSGGSSAWNTAFGTDNGGNIDANPQFVNSADPGGADNLWRTTDDGLQLNTSSPAFNSGNNTGVSATDIVGSARITGGTVDMGAYEANCTPVIPSVVIAITTGTNPACVGSSLTFTATATNGGSSPAYQWTQNGTPINGAMNASYTAIVGTDVMNNDQIACILTSNAACASPTTATSASVVVTTSSLTTRLYVKANAAGANNGTSWNDAFTDLQSALNYKCFAAGAEIWVAAGTYKPTTSTDRNASFFLPSGIKLYGGFAGTESNLNQRPTHVIGGGSNATILSGNIGDTGIDTDNSYNVVAAFETAPGTAIDGFIIEKGYADISNSVLVNGIYKPSNAGAGILLADKSSNTNPTHLLLRNCWIRSNTSTANGTALRFYAASLTSDIDVVVKECVFSDNNGLQGSAAGFSLDGNNGKVNVAVTNSLFLRQTSGNYSVFYINDGSNSTGMTVKFINNTFTNNTSGNAYNTLGVLNGVQATTSFVFSNNIMWGNNYDQTYNNIQMVRNSSSNASVTVTNNLIEDGYSGGGTAANNLDANPLFTNTADPDGADNIWGTADDGLKIANNSPSKNTGTNTNAPATDITGLARPQEDITDMGAYESFCTLVTPTILTTITTGGNPTCAGNSITFTATITHGGDNPTYQWTKNGNNILNATQAIYTGVAGTDFVNGDLIRCVLTSSDVCATSATATSLAITIVVNSLPMASIVSNNSPVCLGGTATFTVAGTAGAILTYNLTGQINPQTLVLNGTNQVVLANGVSGNVTLTLLSVAAGLCNVPLTAMSTITTNAPPVVSTPQSSLCSGLTMTLSPNSGGNWVSSNPSKASVTNEGLVTGISP